MSELKGLEEALKKLSELPTKIHGKIAREALTQASELVRATAFRNLESIGAVDSARLLNSITASKPRTRRALGEVKTMVSAEFYGRFIENGFFNIRAQKHIPGRPWLVPALQESEAAIIKIVEQKVREVVSKVK